MATAPFLGQKNPSHTAFPAQASYERSTTSDLWARHKDLPPAESGNFTGKKWEKWMDLRKKKQDTWGF